MPREIIKSWEKLWAIGQTAGGTHWNYSRGMVRFRAGKKQPTPLGVEIPLDTDAPIRVRFYVQKGKEFIEQEGSEVLFKPVPIERRAFPPDFDSWPRERRQAHIKALRARLSAIHDSPEKAKAIVESLPVLEYIDADLSKAEEFAVARAKAAAEAPPARINNIWEFLQHPNAEEGMRALFLALTQNKERAEDLTAAIKKLPLLHAILNAAGRLPPK